MATQESVFIPVIIGLIEITKRLGLPSQFSPLVALALGLGFSLTSGFAGFETILSGLIYGLASAGLYSGTKAIIGK